MNATKDKAVWYHGGCDVCATAESNLVDALDPQRFAVEKVNLTVDQKRVDEAERAGVRTLPALVVDGQVFHVNFGANLADLK